MLKFARCSGSSYAGLHYFCCFFTWFLSRLHQHSCSLNRAPGALVAGKTNTCFSQWDHPSLRSRLHQHLPQPELHQRRAKQGGGGGRAATCAGSGAGPAGRGEPSSAFACFVSYVSSGPAPRQAAHDTSAHHTCLGTTFKSKPCSTLPTPVLTTDHLSFLLQDRTTAWRQWLEVYRARLAAEALPHAERVAMQVCGCRGLNTATRSLQKGRGGHHAGWRCSGHLTLQWQALNDAPCLWCRTPTDTLWWTPLVAPDARSIQHPHSPPRRTLPTPPSSRATT